MRAGTGGDEAALFAADLLRMYERAAALHGWKFEVQALVLSYSMIRTHFQAKALQAHVPVKYYNNAAQYPKQLQQQLGATC